MSPERRSGPGASRHLFTPLSAEAAKALAGYPELLRRALGLRPSMERDLPRQVRILSQSLTAEREGGPRPGYLADPRTLAAYAWYFLPWNLVRLCRLLPGLPLAVPEDGLVRDLGAGPLTLMQALWLSRPDLRAKRLRFICVDRSRRALDLGLRLFADLAGFDPAAADAPWRVRLVRGEYWQGLDGGEAGQLTAMVNVANEMTGSGREPLAERMERLAGQVAESLAPGGRLLLVEPGTRLGWRCLAGMRQALVEMGLGLEAPCPHPNPCPLAEGRVRAWCHFITSPRDAPAWLTTFSERAGLPKERLSLSFLLARAGRTEFPARAARVVSGAFALTDVPGSAVYACSGQGLLVLVSPQRQPPRSGDLLPVVVPADAPVDPKSGAPRVVLVEPSAPPAPAASAPDRAPRPPRRPARSGGRPVAAGNRGGRKGPPAGGGPRKVPGGGRSSER